MSSVWDEIKDMFKTKKQLAEEKQQKISDALSREEGLVKVLEDLQKQYEQSLPKDEEVDIAALFPKDSGLKEIEYAARSDSDIDAAARAENAYKKTQKKNEIESKFASDMGALESGKQQAKQNLEEGYKQLGELYDELRKNAENDSLKRGMARSSVITSQLNNLDRAQLESAGNVEAAYQSTVGAIDQKINALQNDRELALNELDLRSAAELGSRIDELRKERDDTVLQYEKYNNSVREKNIKYEQQRQDDIAQFLAKREKEKQDALAKQQENENKYGYSGDKLKNYTQRYNAAYQFYSSLSPDIAADALAASPNMKYYLGQYYDTLMSALKSSQVKQTKYF